jgi:mRNA interferase MazF
MPLHIKAAPKVRQLYWCDFRGDARLPEMGKKRPAIILSYRNTLHGIVLVLPTSTDPQEGISGQWAHKLSFQQDGKRDSWVVCNHLYTVSTQRLEPFGGPRIPRLEEDEFNLILATTLSWLPRLPVPPQPQEH